MYIAKIESGDSPDSPPPGKARPTGEGGWEKRCIGFKFSTRANMATDQTKKHTKRKGVVLKAAH